MISLIEDGGTAATLIRRCLWCAKRTANKKARYFINGEWQIIFDPVRYFGDCAKFTDGICPECAAIEKEKLKS